MAFAARAFGLGTAVVAMIFQPRRRWRWVARPAALGSTEEEGLWYLACEAGEDVQAKFEWAWRSRRPMVARKCVDVSWFGPDMVDEVAGLSLESDVASRLVLEHGSTVERGPFAEDRFDQLKPQNWTVLVNDVEMLLPRVATAANELWSGLLAGAGWARDDVMVSLAARGGGVGPHVDSSDVVLLQAAGRRRWSLERWPVTKHEAQQRRDETRQANCLSNFSPALHFTLEPGDFLYVPAQLPHDGVALTSDPLCATISLGFRSMTSVDLATGWIDAFAFWDDENTQQYDMLAGVVHTEPRGIPSEALDNVKAGILAAIERKLDDTLPEFLGETLTAPRDPALNRDAFAWNALLADSLNADIVHDATATSIEDNSVLCRAPGARFAFHDSSSNIRLFVNGKASRQLHPDLTPLVRSLCMSEQLCVRQIRPFLSEEAIILLDYLLENKYLIALRLL